jgi:hypothetical protein
MNQYQSVLDKINLIRNEFALNSLDNLPKGRKQASNSCPLAKALLEIDDSVEVQPDNIQFYNISVLDGSKICKAIGIDFDCDNYNIIPLPKDMENFVDLFDSGRFPELDINYKGEAND